MKSFVAGLTAILIIGLAVFALRGKGLITTPQPSPTPSGLPSNWDMAPDTSPDSTPAPSTTPTPTVKPATTTKGGETSNVLGGSVTTTGASSVKTSSTVTTTNEKQVINITILESSDCQLDATSYLRDITSPLTIRYSLKDNYSAKVTIWKTNGEEILPQTLIKGSGLLKEINTRDDLKFQIVSNECEETSDTWLRLTASN